MGKKYIIELEEPEMFDDRKFYTCSQMPWWAVSENIVENLTPYTEPDTEKVRKEAYEQGKMDAYVEDSKNITMLKKEAEEAYQRGLSDAWEAARKLVLDSNHGGLTNYDIEEIFGVDEEQAIINYSASEAIEKIRQYKQKQEEIHLGDEVTFLPNNAKGIVTECHVPDVLYGDNDKYAVWCGGTMEYVLKQHLTKTGRTFPEIAEVLQKMKEES